MQEAFRVIVWNMEFIIIIRQTLRTMELESMLAIALLTMLCINIQYIEKGERSFGPSSSTLHLLYNM